MRLPNVIWGFAVRGDRRLHLAAALGVRCQELLDHLGDDAPDQGQTMREHRDLTPLTWGEVFHNKIVVSEPAMRMIRERRGHG
ncbi:MAG: hypothetical protein HY337_01505 [Gemmatimonadetes bacterium]|nr:hypothetical protein [Gemmatimonadota bacterium]